MATKAPVQAHHQTNGRTPLGLPEFTFPDSGYTVRIRKLSPLTMEHLRRALRKELPPPEPPVNLVDYGDGSPVAEPNPADPAYQARMVKYETDFNTEIFDRMLRLFATYALDFVVDQEALDALATPLAAIGAPLEGDPRELYFRHVLIQSGADMAAVREAIFRQSQPTEAAIQEHTDSFRGNVQG